MNFLNNVFKTEKKIYLSYSDYNNRRNLVCSNNNYVNQPNITGPNGFDGPTGPWGYPGVSGMMGPMGPTGHCCTGYTGATGTIGKIGLANNFAGPIGCTGYIGPIGCTGNIGPIGCTGYIGPIGCTGTTGINGNLNVTGGTGINFSPTDNYSFSLSPYNSTSNTNVNENTILSWSIDKYGRSSVTTINPNGNTGRLSFNTTTTDNTFTDNDGAQYKTFVVTQTPTTMTVLSKLYVSMCLVGGGGGGANSYYSHCSGAGAGELMFVNNYLLSSGTYTITIGSGGTGATAAESPGSNGNPTNIKNSSSITLFQSAGGAGAVVSTNGVDGILGSIYNFPTYSSIELGTSSASGGGSDPSSSYNGGTAITSNYSNVIVPYLNINPPQVWSYGSNGGNSHYDIYNNSGGGGGGAGGVGFSPIDQYGGTGGVGLNIYFDNTGGRSLCGGSAGTGDYTDKNNNDTTYGAGKSEYYNIALSKATSASNNTGSGGGSSRSNNGGGNGGSGLFMIRYQIN